jgi:FkbM family methyltransferase
MNLDIVAKHITPTHVFDIGANVGGFYKQSKALWPSARFWLIEANPKCCAFLEDEIKSTDGTDLMDIAVLSDREKEVTFYTMRDCDTPTGASYYRENTPFYSNPVATKRRTTTLDALTWQSDFHLAECLLIKVDAQGADLDILQGGKFMVGKAKAIICEVSHVEYNEGATNSNESVAKFMAEHDFYAAERLQDIVHPIEREKIIQTDMLYLRI